ncbi:MAG: hypothetical protein JNL32_04665, partial [Candidatus Kapabacteria bacterium]|nr:hypothetical protein [Candidatus Kapabacteria bacterium]
ARWAFATGVVISFLTPFVNSVPWFYIVPEFVGTFLSYQHGSIFPIFPYASYMFIGAAAGVALSRVPKEDRFGYIRRMSWRIALLSGAAGGVLALVIPMLGFVPDLDFLQSSPACVWLRVGAVSAFIYCVSLAYPLMRRFENLLALFGKQSLVVYVVHLIILFGTPWFPSIGRFYVKNASLEFGLLAAVVVVGGTLLIVYAEDLLARNAGRILRYARLSLAAMLAYALLL